MAMVFPTSPTVGQVFTSGGRSWVWNGSAWDAPSATNVLQVPIGMDLIRSQSFSGQGTLTLNNVFSSAYDNYTIDLYLTQNTTASDSTWTLVNGSTPAASNWGHNTLALASAATAYNAGASNQPAAHFYPVNAGAGIGVKFTIYSPFIAARTTAFVESITNSSGYGGNHAIWTHAILNNSTSYEGFRYNLTAGSMTGTIRVYGLRNAV
jgi:hypothetical protein